MIKPVNQIKDISKFSTRSSKPCVVKGIVREWPAYSKWDLDYFEKYHGDKVVPVSNYIKRQYEKSRNKKRITIKEYIDNIKSNTEYEEYLAGWHFLNNAPELMDDIIVPSQFRNNLLDMIHNKVINYESTSIFIGHKNSESPLHTDSFFVCVWLSCVKGRKLVRLVEPTDYDRIKNGINVYDDDVVSKFDDDDIHVYDTILEEGDILFIPPGWWHQVKNMGFSIAVSTNFTDEYHFLTFEQQLRAKIISPYLKLFSIKNEIFKNSSSIDVDMKSIEHANYIANEKRYLSFMKDLIKSEENILESLENDASRD